MASSGELLEAINYVPMIRDEFVRLVVNIKKRGVHNFTLPFLEDRLAALEMWLNVLHKTHVKITTHTKPAELAKMEYVTDSWYQAALDAHSDAEEFILGQLDELRSSQVMSSSGHTAPSGEINHIGLPIIDLPMFSGDYLEWNNFYETFRSIVHDKVYVSGRDKFHYLKFCLQGEAATVIKSLAITSENYEIAWDTLVARYTDKRMITDTFLDQISQVPTLRGDNFKVLKEVRDSVTVALNALKTMGYGVDQWDPIIVHSLKNKLDDTLRLAWEMYLGSSKDYPTCSNCSSSSRCRKCSKMHHTLLHFDKSGTGGSKARGTTPAVNSSSEPEPSSSNTTTHLSVSDTRSVLLATFSAGIDAHDGSPQLRFFLSGSRKTLTRILRRLETSPELAEIFKTENQKTKIRVVFNASSKTSTGVSLNDTLFIGPKLQQDITRILMNWRAFRYFGVTDIVKMFRQILVRFEDRKYQNILWKTDCGELKAFELNTVTYGTGPAPFLSSRVLRELASTDGADFPLAQDVLLNSTYVDDLLFGAHDLKQLSSIREQLIALLAKGGFSLSKWAFNQPGTSPLEPTEPHSFFENPAGSSKVLGIYWDHGDDSFRFRVSPSSIGVLTKRILLSENAKIFDPLGWISPIVITLKQLMQSTWLLKLSWDEEIPEPIQSKWLKCYEQLCDLQALSIPRWTGRSLTTRKRELIGFFDASELAYGAVAYERLTDENGHFSVHLVMSKTKVAPIKTTSILRLELVAAALLVKLLVHVKTSLVGSCDAIRCYLYSQVALAWIAKQPVHWKTFVANRVSYIQTHLPEASWHYVPTKLNPADLCSRGTSVQQQTHLETLHGGLQLTLSTLRQRFWVVNARNLVKSCVHKCITCVRERAKLGNQLMGSLPAARVSRSFTFEHTGVDYAGPFSVKLHHGRNAKAIKCYVAVFVCLSTRAVHLELVSRLDTEAFLAALSRFISRRGKPAVMYSDNGLNFQGADAELKHAYQCAVEAARARKTDSVGEIGWKFIPVATPHWGGLWESAVKSMKHHLKRSLGVFVPNFEELTTLLTKIEACLNSRPISRLHDDPESLDVLTSGHFLSGRALNSPPEFSTLDLRESSLNRWQTNRPKWQNTNSEFGEGDLVLIKVPNNPPRMWTLGRILKLVPGVDGAARVAILKTARKEIQRSLSQLCKLPS
ncbi:uncharacterized protein [Prorops nasuta]|uniref:uncharacterized protein n=1 Tax=Prorops nasuta TaxID=863751 RepID=UPI0034CF13EA